MSTITETPVLTTAPQQATPQQAVPTAVPVRTLSIVSLVLGATSVLLGYTFLVPIAAIVVGVLGYQREPAARAFSVWGIVLGAVMAFGWLVVGVIGVVFAAPFFLFGLL